MKCNNPQELLDFMSSNINYGYLGKNGKVYRFGDKDFDKDWENQYILQNEQELLENLCGNCFDQVEFERKWFLKHNYEIKTFFEIVKLNYKNVYPTHSFLIFKKDDKWCWFENSDTDNRGIKEFNSIDELLKYQYSKYLMLLEKYNITNEEKGKIELYEFDTVEEHSTSSEYLDHVLSSKKINCK